VRPALLPGSAGRVFFLRFVSIEGSLMPVVGHPYNPPGLTERRLPMSAVIPPTKAWTWPAEVLDFAARKGLNGYLDPLLEATHRLFPTAQRVDVLVERDPEIRDHSYIVFEVYVPKSDIPDYVQAHHSWTDEFRRICPGPEGFLFCFTLIPVV
jgi:hypothetical protein